MIRAEAFSPCSLTGFFIIHDQADNPLETGSIGVSVALELGVRTRIVVRRSRSSSVRATFNGRPLSSESVSAFVARRYLQMKGGAWHVIIDHSSSLPMGYGYGTSGAGALGTSLAMNEILGISLSNVEAAQLAHTAEIARRTGLGTVSTSFSGGLVVRTVPGAPGIGKVTKITLPRTYRLITAGFGPMSTRKLLGSLSLKSRVNACGSNMMRTIRLEDMPANFMDLSRKFSDCLGIWSRRLSDLMNCLDVRGFKSSMIMFGESLFCLVPTEIAGEATKIIQLSGLKPVSSAFASSGAHLL